jgi:hypothetical protein
VTRVALADERMAAAAVAGGSTGDMIATWQRMGSVYGTSSNKKKAPQDPYQVNRCRLIFCMQDIFETSSL